MSDPTPIGRFVRAIEGRADAREWFASGATEPEIEAFRAAVGFPVPDDFFDFYRRFNGTKPMEMNAFGRGLRLGSLESVLRTKAMWDGFAAELETMTVEERRAKAHFGFWHPRWIPFLDDWSAREWVLATVPCFGGPAGQIICFDFKGGSGWRIEHASFEDWLLTMAAIVEEDVPRYDDREGELRRRINPTAGHVSLPDDPTDPARFTRPHSGLPKPPLAFARGDAVKLVSGWFAGKTGRVVEVDLIERTVSVELEVWGAVRTLACDGADLE